MALLIDAVVQNVRAVQQSVRGRVAEIRRRLPPALTAEHELIMTAAKRRTPVFTGALRASGHVLPAYWQGDDVISPGVFGGPSAPYAAIVHEREDLRHRVGQAHFYSSAVAEAAPGLAARVGRRVRAGLGA